MAPYPIFLSALKTVIMPIFVILTESEQFKHISALLLVKKSACMLVIVVIYWPPALSVL